MWTMKSGRARHMVLFAVALLTLEGLAQAQKTDYDGVTVITQNRAEQGNIPTDDTPGFPVTISESGSYRLGSNVHAPFLGVFPAGNVRVLNGVVRGMGSTGVSLWRGCRVDGVHALENGAGVVVGSSCTVVNNVVTINRSVGISAGDGSTVIGNTVGNNRGLGLELFGDAGYVHNVVTRNNGGNANPQVTGGIQMGGNICGATLCP